MDVPALDQAIIITDAAVNIFPTLQDKVDIIQNAIDLAHALGRTSPKVAILSAMETVNPSVPSTIEAAALCKMAERGQITGGILDGPLALDNAIDLTAAKIKKIDSPVAGQADILVVPELEAGNMLAKSLTFMAGADAVGDRARSPGADYPHQPGRLADRAPRLLRRGGAGRGSATPGCVQGDRMILLRASRHKTEGRRRYD
jgi:phosphotransacetylase